MSSALAPQQVGLPVAQPGVSIRHVHDGHIRRNQAVNAWRGWLLNLLLEPALGPLPLGHVGAGSVHRLLQALNKFPRA